MLVLPAGAKASEQPSLGISWGMQGSACNRGDRHRWRLRQELPVPSAAVLRCVVHVLLALAEAV